MQRAHALPHAGDPVRQPVRERRVGQPDAVVAERERHAARRAHEVDHDVLRLRVLDDVGQRFLNDPEQRDRDVRRQRLGALVEVQRGHEAGALAGAAHEPLERGRDAQVVEQRRSQVLGDAARDRAQDVDRSSGHFGADAVTGQYDDVSVHGGVSVASVWG